MNRPPAYNIPRLRWWLFAAVTVWVLSQSLLSGHLHSEPLDSVDCCVCQIGGDQGKKLALAVQLLPLSLQHFTYVIVHPVNSARQPLTAASIRAPPLSLPI